MYRSEYIVCFRSEISFVPLLSSHRTPFLRPYWQIYFNSTSNHNALVWGVFRLNVVSYFNSTSNHNLHTWNQTFTSLFLISILHQTTTNAGFAIRHSWLFLISILHQTTTCSLRARLVSVVVSYFNSTSNHNPISKNWTNSIVVSYFNSTSNHNTQLPQGPTLGVVSYFNSTSNHNWDKSLANLRLVVSYFNSTSNHNSGHAERDSE